MYEALGSVHKATSLDSVHCVCYFGADIMQTKEEIY